MNKKTIIMPAMLYMGWGVAFAISAIFVVKVDATYVGLMAWSGVMTLRYMLEHCLSLAE
jgi:hypothetical protein